MNRRMFLLGSVALVAASPALAQSRTDEIVADLGRQGFSRIEISRTWLGRTRIVATGAPGRREIVLNPNTGEVLRDLAEDDDDRDDDSGRGRGRGRGGDDDDHDNGDDNENGDDNDGGDDRDGGDHDGGDHDGGDHDGGGDGDGGGDD